MRKIDIVSKLKEERFKSDKYRGNKIVKKGAKDGKKQKYKIIYIITYLLLLILVFTKGINIGIEEYSYNNYHDMGMVDGFSGSKILLIYNLLIIITIFTVSLVITLIRENKIKYKNLIFIGSLILLLFIPVTVEHRSGGIAGDNEEIYANILMIPIETKSIK